MKIKTEDVTRNDWLSIMVMHLMTEHAKTTEDFMKVFKIEPGMNSDIDLQIRINGVEVDFGLFMKELQRQHEEMLTKRAHELLRERGLNGIHDIISDLEKNIEDKIEEVFPGFRNNGRENW